MTAMLRAIAFVSAVLFGGLLLYLPSALPTQRFLDLLRAENARYTEFWGSAHADHILSRALDVFGPNIASTAVARVSPPPDALPGQALLLSRVSRAIDGLVHNDYVHGIQSLLLLAMHRLSTLLEWAPYVLVVILAACADGWVIRRIKAREFRQHRPELYAVGTLAIALLIGLTLLIFIAPVALHPLVLVALPLLIAFGGHMAVANYHHAV